jgi:hypothetical protein
MKKVLLVIIIILALTGGLIYYLYTRISYTPEWYDEGKYAVDKEMIMKSRGTQESITNELIKDKKAVMSAEDLAAFVLEEVHQQIPQESDKVIKALRCEVQEDRVLVESVINLDEIPLKKLSPTQQNAVKKLLSSFPKNSRQNFYVGLSGTPVLKNNHIELSEGAKVQLGKMKYPVQAILKQISGNNKLETFVPLDDLPFKNFYLEENKIILEN